MTHDDPTKHDPETAQEVDRLLRRLRYPPPTMFRDPERPGRQASRAAPPPSPPAEVGEPAGPGGVWLRVGLGIVLSIGLTQWPYPHPCGFRLALFLGAVAMIPIAGVWAAVGAWRRRLAVAHLLALLVIGWGAVLAAREVLPRVGYARVEASWLCPAATPSGIPQR